MEVLIIGISILLVVAYLSSPFWTSTLNSKRQLSQNAMNQVEADIEQELAALRTTSQMHAAETTPGENHE